MDDDDTRWLVKPGVTDEATHSLAEDLWLTESSANELLTELDL